MHICLYFILQKKSVCFHDNQNLVCNTSISRHFPNIKDNNQTYLSESFYGNKISDRVKVEIMNKIHLSMEKATISI